MTRDTGCAPCACSGHWAALDTPSRDLSCVSEGRGQGNAAFNCFLGWEQGN